MFQVNNHHHNWPIDATKSRHTKVSHSSLDTDNFTISAGLVTPTNSQYYSTKNNQPDNSNGLPVNYGGNSNYIFTAAKVGSFTRDC